MTVSVDTSLALDSRVAIRPEPFGALAYHYGNRKLVFLRHRDMVAVITSLGEFPVLRDALVANKVAESRWPSFVSAIESLTRSEIVHVN